MALNIVPDKDTGSPPPVNPAPRPLPGNAGPAKKPAGPPPGGNGPRLATKAEIEKWFAKTYLMIGIAIGMVRPITSQAILKQAEACAAANAELCMEDKRLREWITKAMVVGKYGAVVAAHAPILLCAFAESRPEDKRDTLLGFADILADPEALLESVVSDDSSNE